MLKRGDPVALGRTLKRESRADTDPTPDQRVYFRHVETGDLGYLVMRDGEQRIRYDQPNMDRTVRKDGMWKPETEHRPLTRVVIARVAFEADKGLCGALGLHAESRRDWLTLRPQERAAFAAVGPSDPGPGAIRTLLFRRIMRALEPLAKKE